MLKRHLPQNHSELEELKVLAIPALPKVSASRLKRAESIRREIDQLRQQLVDLLSGKENGNT